MASYHQDMLFGAFIYDLFDLKSQESLFDMVYYQTIEFLDDLKQKSFS